MPVNSIWGIVVLSCIMAMPKVQRALSRQICSMPRLIRLHGSTIADIQRQTTFQCSQDSLSREPTSTRPYSQRPGTPHARARVSAQICPEENAEYRQSDDSLWHCTSLIHTPHFSCADSGMQANAWIRGEIAGRAVLLGPQPRFWRRLWRAETASDRL
jgi:hypothetical protein